MATLICGLHYHRRIGRNKNWESRVNSRNQSEKNKKLFTKVDLVFIK